MSSESPLTGTNNVELIRSFDVQHIIDSWKERFDIDISDEFDGIKQFYFYKCNDTKLKFFLPRSIAGSQSLYEKLGQISWYYMPKKWEYDAALCDLRHADSVMEVGCGKGYFLEKLIKQHNKKACGIELNPGAILQASKRGIPVFHDNVFAFAAKNKDRYDAVCAFQVLEHVTNPRQFVSSLLDLVKVGGKIILSVPNAESFIRHEENGLLNLPPHHMTWWSQKTFQYFFKLFPMKIHCLRKEPLADYHTYFYLSVQMKSRPSSIISITILPP